MRSRRGSGVLLVVLVSGMFVAGAVGCGPRPAPFPGRAAKASGMSASAHPVSTSREGER
ncbi:hypothetical protein [Labilithrix luteola]|uniref:hypothetical protein n=1 Tax=Labilithrix luteola TaxID=1391654 RepID=UPI001474E501|nr:hypothetical protein [Labilithrix luteola]